MRLQVHFLNSSWKYIACFSRESSSLSLGILSLCPFATYMFYYNCVRTKMKQISKGKSTDFFNV